MSIIAHASIDENKNIKGGIPGDQTGKEVCTRSWYLKNWQYVIRPKSEKIAAKAVAIATAVTLNPNVGYNQTKRNTLYKELKAHGYDVPAIGKCDTDCSAFMTVCYIAAGVNKLEYETNAPTTSTMVKAFRNTGQFEILSGAEYLRIDARLKPGDVLVQPGHHTVFLLRVQKGMRLSGFNGNWLDGDILIGTRLMGTSARKLIELCVVYRLPRHYKSTGR